MNKIARIIGLHGFFHHPDSLHPNGAGHKIMAEAMMGYLVYFGYAT